MISQYEIFLKEVYDKDELHELQGYDLFLSAYNQSERVTTVFNNVTAHEKKWIVFPEYGYAEDECPTEDIIFAKTGSEGEQVSEILNAYITHLKNKALLIDITGFMRPQLSFLILYLYKNGINKFDLLYTEPEHYRKKENTDFSDGHVIDVKQIDGFEGSHSRNTQSDILIIGSGYDYNLIKSVCTNKTHAKEKIQLLGFPSLRPDMYQENILKASNAIEELGNSAFESPLLAPANDPFITAAVLSRKLEEIGDYTNLYLCSLATKPQAVGFTLFYIKELLDKPASLIFPYFSSYDKETSIGINKAWKYTVEL